VNLSWFPTEFVIFQHKCFQFVANFSKHVEFFPKFFDFFPNCYEIIAKFFESLLNAVNYFAKVL